MDPLSLTLTALVSGACAVLKPTAQQAVKDAYEALKGYIRHKWLDVDVDSLEREPGRKAWQEVLREDLQRAGAPADATLLRRAQAVLVAVRQYDPDAAMAAGITVEDLDAGANANIEDLVAEGAVRVRGVKAQQDINVKGLRSGNPPLR